MRRVGICSLIIVAAVCSVTLIGGIVCYAAEGKAEEFFKQGEKNSTLEKAEIAIQYYSKAIEVDPGFAKAYNNRGVTYIWQKKYDLALADFNKAIELDPKNGKAYNNRAIAYSYQGETSKALQDLRTAQSFGIEVNPDFLKKLEDLPPTPESIFHKPAPASSNAPAKQP